MGVFDILEFVRLRIMNQEQFQNYLRHQGVKIGEQCEIYKNVRFGTEPYLIRIGNHVRLTDNVRFITHDGGMWVLRELLQDNRLDLIKPIVIKDNVFVGWGSVILPGVTIGENSIVAAGAVVTKDIPANEVWGGVPARHIKTIDQYIEHNKNDFIYTHEMDDDRKKKYLMECFDER